MSLVVTLPESVEKQLRAKAQAEGKPVEVLAAHALTSLVSSNGEDWLDVTYHAECESDKTPEVSLEDVRKVLVKIPGSMVPDFISERDE